MNRRNWLRSVAAVAGAAAMRDSLPAMVHAAAQPAGVNRVLLITKCHLDVGFTKTQQQVVRQYFDVYFPEAIETAARLRTAGPDRYIWTTGSWLLYEYLDQASSQQRRSIEEAVSAGDLSWHALPFTWQSEMLDRSMIEGGLSFSAALDARFGRRTIGAKMTDVPGHTRGIIAPLAAAGVRLLDVGVNSASTPPDVPEVFLWKDSNGQTLPMLYHRQDYGGVVVIPGTSVAVAVEVRNDNSGPHTPKEIAAIYARLRNAFPGATVSASTLNEVAGIVDGVRGQLPVVTSEIGDSWIYGVASDPVKIARFREVTRLRSDWLVQRRFAIGDTTDRRLLARLLLTAEHTWGTDTKSYLDYDHYRPADLDTALPEPGYQTMMRSWQEKRDDLDQAISTLPTDLAAEAQASMSKLQAGAPDGSGLAPKKPSETIETAHFLIKIDPGTGAITQLRDRASGREWASDNHPLALFTYQTLSARQYADFLVKYVKSKESWAPRDFGKPGIERFGAVAGEWHPRLVDCRAAQTRDETRVLLRLRMEDSQAEAAGAVAWPREIYLELRLPASAPSVDLGLTVLDKQGNRMPEAMWLTFNPQVEKGGDWIFNKSGEPVRMRDVVEGGGRAMHAVSGAVQYRDGGSALEIRSLDAAMVAIGDRSPLNFSLDQPSPAGGLHFGLFNNAWGTNYPQWRGGNWTYRFTLST